MLTYVVRHSASMFALHDNLSMLTYVVRHSASMFALQQNELQIRGHYLHAPL